MADDELPAPATREEFVKGVRKWINAHWNGGQRPCPYCGIRSWGIGEVVSLSSARQWPISDASSYGAYNVVPITCKNCRHMVLVNVLHIFEEPSA
jgi:hypothetical protein